MAGAGAWRQAVELCTNLVDGASEFPDYSPAFAAVVRPKPVRAVKIPA